jgi:hypothetical protein
MCPAPYESPVSQPRQIQPGACPLEGSSSGTVSERNRTTLYHRRGLTPKTSPCLVGGQLGSCPSVRNLSEEGLPLPDVTSFLGVWDP